MIEKKHSCTEIKYVIELDGKFIKTSPRDIDLYTKRIEWTKNVVKAAFFNKSPSEELEELLDLVDNLIEQWRRCSNMGGLKFRLEKSYKQLHSAIIRKVEIHRDEIYKIKGVNP